ncbi:MAG: hypothetical protein L6Q83_13930, partial [Gammaproteobacteria bacterium]|nr:hypothetical protein [Gammaproteobacteria bacterium]
MISGGRTRSACPPGPQRLTIATLPRMAGAPETRAVRIDCKEQQPHPVQNVDLFYILSRILISEVPENTAILCFISHWPF